MVSVYPMYYWLKASCTVYTDGLQIQFRYFVQANTEWHGIVTGCSLGDALNVLI